MLFRSGENLLEGAISFIDLNSEITLFSAYLKLDSLKKLNKSGNIKFSRNLSKLYYRLSGRNSC